MIVYVLRYALRQDFEDDGRIAGVFSTSEEAYRWEQIHKTHHDVASVSVTEHQLNQYEAP